MEGYLDVVREIASQYGSMSLIEFDGYFEGKFEPIKYTRVEVHTTRINEKNYITGANSIGVSLITFLMILKLKHTKTNKELSKGNG